MRIKGIRDAGRQDAAGHPIKQLGKVHVPVFSRITVHGAELLIQPSFRRKINRFETDTVDTAIIVQIFLLARSPRQTEQYLVHHATA